MRWLVAAALVAFAVQTPTSPGKYVVYGQGAQTCGFWLARRHLEAAHLYDQAWLNGFVSGTGYSGLGLVRSDAAHLEAWIDRYCAQDPTVPLSTAAEELVLSMRVLQRH